MNAELQAKLDALPERPGVYLFKGPDGRVIYVGKAVNLRARVRSYFGASKGHSPKTLALVARVADVETLLTSSGVEALILENHLIKKHRPRYNILLRDDKTYPYLKLTVNEEYPRLLVARRPQRDGALYYGPYVRAAAMRRALRLIHRRLGIRQCDIEIDRRRPRACIYYELGQCGAPCVSWGETREQYQEHVRQARLLLEGREEGLRQELERAMRRASDEERYEEAARLRDLLQALREVQAEQHVVLREPRDVDVVAVAEGAVAVFFIRGGKLIDWTRHRLRHEQGASEAELMAAFLPQYYAGGAYVPEEVVASCAFEGWEELQDWLSRRRGSRVRVTFPKRGAKQAWVRMVRENAEHLMRQEQEAFATSLPPGAAARRVRMGDRKAGGSFGLKPPARDIETALVELQRAFGLSRPPRRIEGFDISHIQGSYTVAAMVVMVDGRPRRSEYRHYRIKDVKGVDDFAAMREVVGRRYRRLLEEKAPLPDLLLIDGGKGQLSAAGEALRALGLEHLPRVGLAKRLEECFLPGHSQPLRLSDRSPGRLMIQRLRDEAHRFALSYHRRLRARALRKSLLDEVPGIGPEIKRRLLSAFGGLEGVRRASLEQLQGVPGVGPALARRLRRALELPA